MNWKYVALAVVIGVAGILVYSALTPPQSTAPAQPKCYPYVVKEGSVCVQLDTCQNVGQSSWSAINGSC